jgi:hypothetical protein
VNTSCFLTFSARSRRGMSLKKLLDRLRYSD